jgi:hypothetical protein
VAAHIEVRIFTYAATGTVPGADGEFRVRGDHFDRPPHRNIDRVANRREASPT